MSKEIKQRLEYFRQEIEKESMSYGDIAELASLAEHIDKGDTLLLEWAGVPEDYKIVDRESEIDNLIRWISETKSDNDKELMKDDLKMLMSLTCKNVYSSESTNDYIEIN